MGEYFAQMLLLLLLGLTILLFGLEIFLWFLSFRVKGMQYFHIN